MHMELAVIAAFGCALCNSGAAILQKISSDKTAIIHTYNAKAFAYLFRQLPYMTGIGLDLLAGVCTLLAVSRLPLFVVQAIIASCVVITALLERIFLKRRLHLRTYGAALIVLAGLVCLGIASHSEKTAHISQALQRIIIIMPLILGLVGAIAVKINHRLGALALAALSGSAFSGVSIIGRTLTYPHPLWHLLERPLIWALVAYGILGMFFFTAALQRTLATIVNGVMTSTQTVVPLLVGIIVLGDTARNGLWLPLWIGCALVISGASYIAFTD